MTDVVMPRLSDSMEEGTVLTWLKQVGDEVALGEELVEIETDKANMAYESDVAGVLVEILAGEGETLPIGAPIARIGDSARGGGEAARGGGGTGEGAASGPPAGGPDAAGSQGPDAAAGGDEARARAGEQSSQVPTAPQGSGASVAQTRPGEAGASEGSGGGGASGSEAGGASGVSEGQASFEPGGAGRVKASPLARRLAQDKGIDLSTLRGSGPDGRIVKRDVQEAAAPPAGGTAGGPIPEEASATAGDGGSPAVTGPAGGAPGPLSVPSPSPETARGQVTVEELTKLQSTVARRMATSKATAPHFYLHAEVDMSRCVEARARLKEAAGKGEVVPSFNDLVLKAAALALREHPKANGAYRDGRFELYERVNVGIAVAAPGALLVPTVFDADRKGLTQIATESRVLAQRAREGTITPPELSGATFTLSNLGMFGIDSFAAVIDSPQAAILAAGAIKERPAVRDGELVAASLMSLTLACDHRILYGAEGAALLARIRTLLEEPLGLAG